MDIVLWIFACMFAIIGVVCIAGDFVFVRRKAGPWEFHVITLYDDPVEVERLLNKYLLRLDWNGPEEKVILVDMGMGPDATKICQRAMRDMTNVRLEAGDNALRDALTRDSL